MLDRVEIWNSGTLPGNLKVEDLKKPHSSHPSNPTLATVLYFGNYIQQVGSGTTEMVRQCKEHGLPEPEFISVRNLEFKTILSRDVFTETNLTQMGLNDRQIMAVKYIKKQGEISRKQYVTLVEISPRRAHLDLTDLVKKKIIVQPIGKGRSVRYKLHK